MDAFRVQLHYLYMYAFNPLYTFNIQFSQWCSPAKVVWIPLLRYNHLNCCTWFCIHVKRPNHQSSQQEAFLAAWIWKISAFSNWRWPKQDGSLQSNAELLSYSSKKPPGRLWIFWGENSFIKMFRRFAALILNSTADQNCIWNDCFGFDSVITFLIKESCLYKDILLKQDKLLHHSYNPLVIIKVGIQKIAGSSFPGLRSFKKL